MAPGKGVKKDDVLNPALSIHFNSKDQILRRSMGVSLSMNMRRRIMSTL